MSVIALGASVIIVSRMSGFEKRLTEELIRLYEEAASDHSRASHRGDFSAGNPSANTVAAIYREIRSRGLEHQKMLLPLLLSAGNGVRCWVAAHALEFEPHLGEAILLDIARLGGLDGLNAENTLKVCREGNLRFP